MYYQVISQCTQNLNNLQTCLDKAEQHAAAKKFDVGVLMTSRLAPDMQSFIYQVQSACDYLQAAASLALGADAAQARGQRADDRRTARPYPENRRFRGERERGAVRGRERAQGQTLLGARQGHRRRDLPPADDDPQSLFPHRDGLRHPPPQRRRCRQDGFPWSYQSGGRLIGLAAPFKRPRWARVSATAAFRSRRGQLSKLGGPSREPSCCTCSRPVMAQSC